MINEVKTLSERLEKLLNTTLAHNATKEPPRLVRANSAFDLYNALQKVQQNPELAKLL